MQVDAAQFGKEIGQLMRDVAAKTIDPLILRIAELEKQIAERSPTPIKGDKGDKGDAGEIGEAGQDGTAGQKGDSGDKGDAGEKGDIGFPGEKGDQGRPGEKGEKGDPGEAGITGEQGRPGNDGKSVTVEEIEALIETRAAKWELDFERRAQDRLLRELERMPKPADGKAGKDGSDGLGFDDLVFEHDGERSVKFVFVRSDQRKEFSICVPAMIYRGVYKVADNYERGDAVTFNGSLWIADDATKSEPGVQASGWRLAVRKGRDGKDGDAPERKSENSPVRLK